MTLNKVRKESLGVQQGHNNSNEIVNPNNLKTFPAGICFLISEEQLIDDKILVFSSQKLQKFVKKALFS